MTEFDDRRRTKARQAFGQAVAEKLGILPEGLAEMVDGCPDQIREALVEATERGRILYEIHKQEAAKESEPGRCCNLVCKEWKQSEGSVTDPSTGEVTLTGQKSYCLEGAAFAVGCLFRMKKPPPNHLDGVSCNQIPEWSEAIDLLRQHGLLEPDDYGRWIGEDFAFKIERVWWAFVELLAESGRIERYVVPDTDGMSDNGKQSMAAKRLLFPEE